MCSGGVSGCRVALQDSYRQTTGISTLKIRHSAESGFTLEVTSRWEQALFRALPTAKLVKTVKAGVRVLTPELRELNHRAHDAEHEATAIETAVFQRLCQLVLAASPTIIAIARACAVVDVSAALALVSTCTRAAVVVVVAAAGASFPYRARRCCRWHSATAWCDPQCPQTWCSTFRTRGISWLSARWRRTGAATHSVALAPVWPRQRCSTTTAATEMQMETTTVLV
jgi:hypothetical protein